MTLIKLGKRLASHLWTMRRIGIKAFFQYHTKQSNEQVIISVAGQTVMVRARSSDLTVTLECLLKEYEFLDDLLPRDFSGLVVDAGGYIGTASIAFASKFPKATVVTIEPSSSNYTLLEKNVAHFKNIHPRKAALGPKAGGRVSLRDRRTGSWGFTIVDDAADRRDAEILEEVPVTSLDQVEQEFNCPIAFLKLDIEGAEKQIFEGNELMLRAIPLVFVELHDRIVAGCTDAFRNLSRDRWILRLSGEKFLSIHRGHHSLTG